VCIDDVCSVSDLVIGSGAKLIEGAPLLRLRPESIDSTRIAAVRCGTTSAAAHALHPDVSASAWTAIGMPARSPAAARTARPAAVGPTGATDSLARPAASTGRSRHP